MKNLEPNREVSNEIASTNATYEYRGLYESIIIEPLLKTFRQVIDNQNHAMQVHLLNLLKVIFSHFDIPESKQDCERIFKDSSFIDSIVKGMRSEVSFVRYHFIQFATTIVPQMKKYTKVQDFNVNIKKLIDCFCQLLKHVDVTLFAT